MIIMYYSIIINYRNVLAMLKKDSKEFWKGVRRKHAADKTANINEIDNVWCK